MDSREHGESSSSPSDKLTVLDAEPSTEGSAGRTSEKRGTGPAKTHVLLSDGSSFFVRTSLWTESGVRVGDEVDRGDLYQLAVRSEAADATDHGMRLLARREHSCAELTRKLLQRGYGRDAVDTAVRKLVDVGHLDDLRFCEAFILQRLRRRPEAEAALRARLLDRGVDERIIGEAFRSVAEEDPELVENAVHSAAAKLARKSEMSDDKLARSLARRGFRTAEILGALKALGRSGEIY